MLAAALEAMALEAHAEDGNIVSRHAFAREACRPCHVVEASGQSPRVFVLEPAFRDIANTSGITATALQAFLNSSHPNLTFTPEEQADVIAYILSLRDRR